MRHIGGEMAGWSDPAPAGGAAYGCLIEALRPLVPPGGRVLVAGPHEPGLIGALPVGANVTLLVRGDRDAHRLGDRPITILCGSLAKLTGTFDVVVALDGVTRLCTVEGPQYDWTDSVRALRRVLRPGGALLLTVENELGVHRLVDRTTITSARTDSDWRPVGEYDTKPGSPARLRAHLAAEGWAVPWLAAAWPLPSAPTFVADEATLRDGPAGALCAAASVAMGVAYAGRPVLSDPRRLAAAAIRGGLGAELAPALLALAFHGPASPVAMPSTVSGAGPLAELPPGRLLEELLIGACLRHDLPTIRRLLTGWMAHQPAATADNVLVDGDTFAVFDANRLGVEPTLAIQRFAATLLAGGYEQPWPAAGDTASLTAILLAAAGLSPGAVPPTDPLPAPDSLREHEDRVRRLEERLADSAARIRHVESELIQRDGELRRARLRIDMFSGRVGYRIARLGTRATRLGARAARKAFRLLKNR
ncbi:hypothetical protein AB0M36_25795 [Actinoplanes sp. NPDC051346]|uniref:hypothetical protein n=1 Tax=Actinoplanes sp. NPDC051346 TaxID=3155048 RepID=UPI00342F97D1